ncbi:MAG: hypothetical protein M1429_04415 [Patescibacteria group bacterium]|nr:hypothetical protein [Patescibacteria group bacterium]
MTLDKNDLIQIREIVREEVHDQISKDVPKIVHDQIIAEVPLIVKSAIQVEILPIKQKIEQIWDSLNEDLISNLTMIEELSKKIKELDARIKKLELSK